MRSIPWFDLQLKIYKCIVISSLSRASCFRHLLSIKLLTLKGIHMSHVPYLPPPFSHVLLQMQGVVRWAAAADEQGNIARASPLSTL